MLKPISGYEDKYLINEAGEVFSISNRWGQKLPQKRKNVVGKVGYEVVSLWKENKESIRYIHRLIAEHFIPNSDSDKKYINHKDGNKLNNTIENLEWVTQAENNIHSFSTGLNKPFNGTKPGEECPSSKLTTTQVMEIRELYPAVSSALLAQRYNVTSANIRSIIKRKTWNHI